MKSTVTIDGNTLRISRIFSASRTQLFSWWSSAEKLQQWTGCKEATRCEIEMDFRVGGSFSQKMHIEGAGDFSFTGEYEEIVEPERIVYSAHFGPATTKVIIEFFDDPVGTKLVVTHEGLPNEIYCKNIAHGTDESFDKLEPLAEGRVQSGMGA